MAKGHAAATQYWTAVLSLNKFLRTAYYKSYSGLRPLVHKNTHSKNLTRGLRPIEFFG